MCREYYERGAGRERRLQCGAVLVGHHCASVYEGDWHRALIVQVLDADTVKVRHVDYGTVETCAAAALRPLPRRWARLPAQALRARLAGVRPCARSRQWPRPAAAHFLHLVRDARLVACLAALDHSERALHVHLVDTSTDEDLYIGDELVRSGHADHTGHTGDQAPSRVSRDSSAGSDLSCSVSASQVDARVPRRLRTWDAETPAPTAPLSSRRLTRLAALHRTVAEPVAQPVAQPVARPSALLRRKLALINGLAS